jgi:tetratricopeptide (TPR) repeat protein
LDEPKRFSCRHLWNYVMATILISGTAAWLFLGLDGRMVLGAAVAWVVLGNIFMPWIINEHAGFLYRWVFHNYKEAHKRYRKAVDTGKATANAYCALGSLAYAEGDMQESVSLLEEAVSRLPLDVPARVVLARALVKAGRSGEGFEVAQDCLGISGDNPLSHIILGDVLMQKGDLIPAASSYQKALAIAPGIFHCHLKLGEIHFQAGRTKEAAREFDKAAELAPENPDLLYLQGMILWKEGNLLKARQRFQKALEKRPIGDYAYQVPYKELVSALSGVNNAL